MENIVVDNLKDIEFILNGIKFKDGDKIKLNHSFFNSQKQKMENSIANGVIKFQIYYDGEGYMDEFHLGLQVEIDGYGSFTLPDIFEEIIFD